MARLCLPELFARQRSLYIALVLSIVVIIPVISLKIQDTLTSFENTTLFNYSNNSTRAAVRGLENIQYNEEELVVSQGVQDYYAAITDGAYKARKNMVCALFTDSSYKAAITLRSNAMASAHYCDWAVIVYDGDPAILCSNITVIHCERFHAYRRNVTFIPKTIMYEALLPHLKYYKRVMLLDQDILFKNFNMFKFLQIWDCSFVNQSAPLIVQPLISDSIQPDYRLFLHAASWASLRAEGVVSSATGFVEQQVPAFDSIFFEWFIRRVIHPLRNSTLRYNSDWGNDDIWCNAAKMYAKRVLHWEGTAIVCGLIIGCGPVHHLRTRSMHHKYVNPTHFMNSGREILRKYSELYPTWTRNYSRLGTLDPLDDNYGIQYPKMTHLIDCTAWKIDGAMSSNTSLHFNQEENAIEEGKVDYANALLKTVTRKKVLCASFVNTDKAPMSNLYSNVMLAKDSCEWALVFYHGNPDDVCSQSWIKPRLALCVAHRRDDRYRNKTVPKSVLYRNLLPALYKYERVFLMDEDISFKDFDISNFLSIWSCAFVAQAAPLIVQPLISENTQYFKYVYAGSWTQHKEKGVVASSTHYVEQQVPAFDSRFLEWYIRRVIGRVMSAGFDLEADWGFERMWCGAAKAYSKEVLGWAEDDVVCALLVGADPVHHLHTKTIKARSANVTEFQNLAFTSIHKYHVLFPTWKVSVPAYHSPAEPKYWAEYVRTVGIDHDCMASVYKKPYPI